MRKEKGVSKSELEVFRQLMHDRRYAEVLLLAWGVVENYTDLLLVEDFGLVPYKDERSEFLMRGSNLERKLLYLEKRGILSNEDFVKVDGFRKDRNRNFFHKDVIYHLLANDKMRFTRADAEEAIEAVNVLVRALLSPRFMAKFQRRHASDPDTPPRHHDELFP